MINGQYQIVDASTMQDVKQSLFPSYGWFLFSHAFAAGELTLRTTGIQVPLEFNISGPFGAPSVA
jgi:hypothetical protein